MNAPNILTLSRIGLAAVLMVLLSIPLPFAFSLALLVFVAASITDYFDGYLARHVYGETSFGRLMDPLADKVLVCAAFVSFVAIRLPLYKPNAALVPAWIVVVIISREFLVTGLRLLAAGRGKVIAAGKWGKHKTVWQIVVIVVILLGLAVRHDLLRGASRDLLKDFDFVFWWVAQALAGAAAIVTVGSGWLYFTEHREFISQRSWRKAS